MSPSADSCRHAGTVRMPHEGDTSLCFRYVAISVLTFKSTRVTGVYLAFYLLPTSPSAESDAVKVVFSGPDDSIHMRMSSMQHDINYVGGLDGIEGSLDWIAKGLARLTSEDHTVNLTLGQGSNISPVKITLAENNFDDTMDRLVTAVERIADSLARVAGLSRPRLESWHEQDEYDPRYKASAPDGGAPGPKAETT